MPAELVIPVGFAQVQIQITHSGMARRAMITYGVDVSGAGGDYLGIAQDIPGLWQTGHAATFDDNTTFGPVTLRVGQDGGEALVVTGTASFVGTASSQTIAPNNALLVRKLTSRGGRRGRGRMYIPWILGESNVDEVGRVDSGYAATRNVALATLRTAHGTSSPPCPMVLLHATSADGVDPPTTPGPPDPITALVCDLIVGSQRRRLGRP